jgi:peptidoglycan/xylan/chitin deacetylase (PgdA/CDA1 family)
MSVSRGKFLKSLGKALPGMVLGGGMGLAGAAQKLIGKVAAASEAGMKLPTPAATSPAEKIPTVDFIKSGPPRGNQIALTFDDGPTPGVTDRILDELKRRGFRATFFMIGERIAAAPDLARRVLAEGHEIGNHTLTHPKLTTLSDSQVKWEIEKTQEMMEEHLNFRARLFRPPYGALRKNQAGIVQDAGLEIILWSVDSVDWSQPGEARIVETVLAPTQPGSIILCHDLYEQTANSLGSMLDGLFARGFSFSKVSQLLVA